MKRLARTCVALAALAALLSLPRAASATVLDIPSLVPPQFRALMRDSVKVARPHRGFEASLRLEARDGFEVVVFGVGNVVAIEVARRKSHPNPLERFLGVDRAATAYVTRGVVTRHRIEASFGRLGKVDVRFRPSGRVVTSDPRRHCSGPDRFTSRLGVFAGIVRFHGEKHYVTADARRAKGRVRTPLRLACSQPFFALDAPAARARPVRQHPSFEATALSAGHREAVAGTEVFAFRVRKLTLFFAISEENTGRMAEIRYGFATAPSKLFSANDALTRVRVRPPAPFHGTGVYAAAPDGTTTWEGNLSVSLPGAPRLPLTGDRFTAKLEAGV